MSFPSLFIISISGAGMVSRPPWHLSSIPGCFLMHWRCSISASRDVIPAQRVHPHHALCDLLIALFIILVSCLLSGLACLSSLSCLFCPSPASQERKAILFLPIVATFPQRGILQSSLLCLHWLHNTPGNYFKHHLSNTPLWGVESGHSVLWTKDAIGFLPYLKL